MALPGPNEIVASLYGAVRLLRRDPGGLNDFNLTEEGFWRSFFAMAFVLPLSALAAVTFRENTDISAMALASRATVNLTLQWAAFTAAMLAYAHAFQLSHNYMRFITAYNWSSVIATCCMMVPVLLYNVGILGSEGALVLVFFIFLAMLTYFWYVAREALDCGGFVAAGVVFMDFFLNVTIERLFGLTQSP